MTLPDTGFSYLRALLIGAIPGVSFPHLCQYGVRLLSLPPPCDRGGPLIQFGSVMTAGSLTFGDKDPELLVTQKDCVSRFLTLPDSPVVYSTSLCSTSPPARWVLSEHFDFLSILDLTVLVAS